MFERYTERARRVLFFARYESSALGSLSIETEHLLLGLIREGKGLTSRVFARSHLSLEAVQKDIQERVVRGDPISTSVEIPFSPAAKRVLQAAATEADRLLHNYIGTEHLLLGLLTDATTVAGQILAIRGLTLQGVREDIVQLLNEKTTLTRAEATGRPRRAYAMTVAPERTPTLHQPDPKGTPDLGVGFGSPVEFAVATGIHSGDAQRTIGPITQSGTTLADFALMLEEILDAPVIDVTGLEGRYDIDVPGPHPSVESFIAALAMHTGLILTPNASSRRGSR